MSTSVLYHAFQISGVKYKSASYEGSAIIFHAETTAEYHDCPPVILEILLSKDKKNGNFTFPQWAEKNAF